MSVKLEGRGWTSLRIAAWTLVCVLVIAPAVAMRFTEEVSWTGSDFVFAAVLLGGSGLAIEWLMRVRDNLPFRLGAGLTVLSLLFMVWSNLAVGIVGSENDPFNLLYFGILPLVALGAFLTRLEPRGMAAVMTLAALVPVAMMIAAFVLGKHLQPLDSVREVVLVNALFTALFGVCAALFGAAAAVTSPARTS